jgi:hypothetical protein
MILSTDELTGTTRAQPNPPTMNYLRLILGNEIDDNDPAPQILIATKTHYGRSKQKSTNL